MSQVFHNIKVGLDNDLAEKIALLSPGYSSFRILRESIDARKRHELHQVFSVEVFSQGEEPQEELPALEKTQIKGLKPIIVGSGPAGLFCALRFVERGIPCILLERGSTAQKRILGINQHWRYGKLDPNNNVCYGEGGAGLYSDGKLITRIKSPHIPYVMDRLVQFGAPSEIRYLSNPHVGSDRIRRVIPLMREYLLANGCEIHFDTKVEKLLIENSEVVGVETSAGKQFYSEAVVLAVGHSAKDMLNHLKDVGVQIDGKSFAVGLRIEHPQKQINQIQYRAFQDHPKLGSANYKLAHHDSSSGVGVYSFCMCPGGYVLSSGTEDDGVVCNGMSNYRRNSPFANAAIVVSIDHEKNFGDDTWGGLKMRDQIEQSALQSVIHSGGTKEIPVQRAVDFMKGKRGAALPSSTPSGVVATRLDEVLPSFVTKKIREGLEVFNDQMEGFLGPEAQLHGVETRTSSPIRVTRDPKTFESLSHKGLYPAGEGAGYSGGITSSAVDGINIAEAIIEKFLSTSNVVFNSKERRAFNEHQQP